MRVSRRNTNLFQEGHVWKEKISDAHIILGHPNQDTGMIPCYQVYVKQGKNEISYEKRDYWCDAHPTALFEHFIKII